jgi:hypothetical protein
MVDTPYRWLSSLISAGLDQVRDSAKGPIGLAKCLLICLSDGAVEKKSLTIGGRLQFLAVQ